ncbi:unnamed protein product [Polarella glacialis]|uniref:Ammonium transporter n=1 Tax=Polarella glacialis TaxID=89957 RepID=A0A813LWB4_POLGL|nr:unnamed protein product [Polarella glacialis]
MAMRKLLLPLLAANGASLAVASEVMSTEAIAAELRSLKEEVAAMGQKVSPAQDQLSTLLREERKLQAVTFVTQAAFDTEVNSFNGALDSAWLILCGALVMIMHAGFAMLETGCCRAKNAQNVLMKNLVNVCVGTMGWYFFGWAVAMGGPMNDKGYLENHFIGTKGFAGSNFLTQPTLGQVDALNGANTSPMLLWFFQWAFCTAGATIVSGGVAERVKSPSYALFAFVMASFIYPVVVAWTWGYGWLSEVFDVGYMDFAGSGIVHLTGGVSALAGTIVLGPRKGRFDPDRAEEFEAHSLPLVVLGTFILWFGWYGFNPGSTLGMHTAETGAKAAQIAMNTTLAAATGGITVFAFRYLLTKKYDVGGLCNGILAGLVSITAGCSNMECGSAFATGLIGAFVYQGASMLLVRLKIDDPVDASPVHMFCGIWGCLATVLFDWGKGFDHFNGWSGFSCMAGDDGACLTGIGGKAIAANVVMIIVICLWAGSLSGATFFALRMTGALRIDDDTEHVGLDHKQHSPSKAYSID